MRIKAFIIDLIIGFVILFGIFKLFPVYYDSYLHYLDLYNTIEQSEELLRSAYWYHSISFLIISVGIIIYVILSLLSGLLLKYNDKKFIGKYLIVSILLLVIITVSTYLFGSFIVGHKLLLFFNISISICLVISYSLLSYFNNKKTKA